VPEIVDDGRTGFIDGDDDALADALHRVDELDRVACRQATVARFSAGRMVHDHLTLFRRLLADRAPRPLAASAAG
jgi:glycosyltransferase involved in cell wall biosynthesis